MPQQTELENNVTKTKDCFLKGISGLRFQQKKNVWGNCETDFLKQDRVPENINMFGSWKKGQTPESLDSSLARLAYRLSNCQRRDFLKTTKVFLKSTMVYM